jgi:hypothetical protein
MKVLLFKSSLLGLSVAAIVSLVPIAQSQSSSTPASPTQPTAAPGPQDKFYVTPNCQITTQASNNLRLQDRFPLSINSDAYQFYIGLYQDGGPIFCLSKTDGSEFRVLDKLPVDFVNGITLDPRVPNALILASREGNGMEVPINNWGIIFKTTQPEIVNLNILRQAGRVPVGQKVSHAFQGKAGEPVTIVLDSRAQAGFIVRNSRGARVISGLRNQQMPMLATASFTLPATDTYEVIVSGGKGNQVSYMLSVNADRIR